jgi:CRP-like cAMP-binding protein
LLSAVCCLLSVFFLSILYRIFVQKLILTFVQAVSTTPPDMEEVNGGDRSEEGEEEEGGAKGQAMVVALHHQGEHHQLPSLVWSEACAALERPHATRTHQEREGLRAWLLRPEQFPFFAGLCEDTVNELISTMQVLRCVAGEWLYHQGTEGLFFYTLVKGQCRRQVRLACAPPPSSSPPAAGKRTSVSFPPSAVTGADRQGRGSISLFTVSRQPSKRTRRNSFVGRQGARGSMSGEGSKRSSVSDGSFLTNARKVVNAERLWSTKRALPPGSGPPANAHRTVGTFAGIPVDMGPRSLRCSLCLGLGHEEGLCPHPLPEGRTLGGSVQELGRHTPGDSFGQACFGSDFLPHGSSVQCVTACVLLCVPSSSFEAAVAIERAAQMANKVTFLAGLRSFSRWSHERTRALAHRVQELAFPPRHVFCQQNDRPARYVYFIKSGRVDVVWEDDKLGSPYAPAVRDGRRTTLLDCKLAGPPRSGVYSKLTNTFKAQTIYP